MIRVLPLVEEIRGTVTGLVPLLQEKQNSVPTTNLGMTKELFMSPLKPVTPVKTKLPFEPNAQASLTCSLLCTSKYSFLGTVLLDMQCTEFNYERRILKK